MKFSRRQWLVLGVLSVLTLIVIVALLVTIINSNRATPLPTPIPWPTPTVFEEPPTPVDGESTATPFAPDVPATLPPTARPYPTATPGATPTPILLTPAPPVATRYDLQIKSNPNNIELRLLRGRDYLARAAYQAAYDDFAHAATLDPMRLEAYLGLGESLFYLRRWIEAEQALDKALNLAPESPEAHLWRGLLEYYEGRYIEAALQFDRAAELNPDLVDAEAWLAMALTRQGDIAGALQATGRGLQLAPNHVLLHVAQGYARAAGGDLVNAEQDFLEAIQLDSHNFEALNGLARFYIDYQPERVDEAEQALKRAQQWARTPFERAQVLHTEGRYLLTQNRPYDAKLVLRQALDLVSVEGRTAFPDILMDLNRALQP